MVNIAFVDVNEHILSSCEKIQSKSTSKKQLGGLARD